MTFELLLRAAFVTDEIWGDTLEPARTGMYNMFIYLQGGLTTYQIFHTTHYTLLHYTLHTTHYTLLHYTLHTLTLHTTLHTLTLHTTHSHTTHSSTPEAAAN